jgi:flagellar motor switch protein FliM
MPMLEVVCDRMVRTFTTSMRNLTSDAIEVTLDEVTSVRFGDCMNRLALPAMIGVFHVEEWDNYGILTVESSLIYAVVDALLGGRKGSEPVRIEGRGFTTIETMLVSRMLELALTDLAAAFEPITPVTAKLERIETNPRFAAIAGTTNICAVANYRVDMEGRGGKFSILLPYASMEPCEPSCCSASWAKSSAATACGKTIWSRRSARRKFPWTSCSARSCSPFTR